MQSHLSEQEIRDILVRAVEIDLQVLHGDNMASEIQALVAAAEESGLSRDAVLQAVDEKLNVKPRSVLPGERVFAKSADGKFYVAEVLEVTEGSARIRFMKGGEHHTLIQDTQPCAFLPGSRVVCPWPDFGRWTCTVISYETDEATINANDGWGQLISFPLRMFDSIRLEFRGNPGLFQG